MKTVEEMDQTIIDTRHHLDNMIEKYEFAEENFAYIDVRLAKAERLLDAAQEDYDDARAVRYSYGGAS